MGWPLACRSHPGERSNLLIDTTSSALAFHFGVFTFFRRTPEALLKFFPSFFFVYFLLFSSYSYVFVVLLRVFVSFVFEGPVTENLFSTLVCFGSLIAGPKTMKLLCCKFNEHNGKGF